MTDRWEQDLETYLRQTEPDQAEKSAAWQTAIGLQDVDGLRPSPYLLETAQAHIQGKIDMPAAKGRIQSYYAQRQSRQDAEAGTREADLVSVRIAEILGEKTFQFSPVTLRGIHRRLFTGVFPHAGQFRPYNITKREWVLQGQTVIYAPWEDIPATLDYDFAQEKQFSYQGLAMDQVVAHIARSTADLWQIHPFCEGNTRTTAVFLILYLRALGFSVGNDVFAAHAWYFRNALVRANYNDLQKGIHATPVFLEQFFQNLLLGASHPLKNRYLHVGSAQGQAEKGRENAQQAFRALRAQAAQDHPREMTPEEINEEIRQARAGQEEP
jgi:fido (protein-threonine AMPylation protein)